MTAAIAVEGVAHAYDATPALAGIDLDVPAGAYVVLLGPSGCGKTTLLSILGGFVAPTRGRVRLDGRDVTHLPPARRPTATVFQDFALFPHMSLRDNVAFGPRMAGVGRRERRERAHERLALVGLDHLAHVRPSTLSGGQKQRVALARALAAEPAALLLDEPLGALDLKLRRAMQDELKAIQRTLGTTFVHVTHDQEEAMAIADRIVVMNAGRIEDHGPPERLWRRPASLFAAGFLGETNRIPGEAAGEGVDTPLGRLPVAPPDGAHRVTVCVRPQALGRSGAVALGRARVVEAGFLGSHVRARCRAEPSGLALDVHLPPAAVPAEGETIALFAEADALSAFPAEETP
ncbi:MAG: ABC transporter ATP-binding protein [Paracoccaceae bacterium]